MKKLLFISFFSVFTLTLFSQVLIKSESTKGRAPSYLGEVDENYLQVNEASR